MHWKYKATIQHILGALPMSSRLNYFFQRHIAHNLPASDELMRERIADAEFHFRAWQQQGDVAARPEFFEFGAGWDLVQPLLYRMWGATDQVVTDVERLAKLSLINDAIKRLPAYDMKSQVVYPLESVSSFSDLKDRMGIDYRAPLNGTDTGLDKRFAMISSTNTLEHVPQEVIVLLLRECARLLEPGGVLSCRIDYQDHYAYFDPAISLYNYLQYSDSEWKKYNVSLQYQNRLRQKDWEPLFAEAGFEVVKTKVYEPTAEDISTIGAMKIDERYEGYSAEELAIRWGYWVVRPR